MTKINKEGWEIKKLGEVCEIKSGFTPKSNELFSEGQYPYYKVADMNTPGNEVYLDATISYLRETKKYYRKGAIVFPKNGAAVSTNKKRILKHDSIVDLNTAIATFTENISSSFGYYWFLHTDFRNNVRGGALPTLDIKSLAGRTFPLPPLPIQQRIVDELDEINAIISAKKQQLSKLDELAQSIFYDMFGDPVLNDKGWPQIGLGSISDLKNGLNFDKTSSGLQLKFLGVSEFQNNRTLSSKAMPFINVQEEPKEEFFLQNGDFVFVRSNGSKDMIGRSVLVSIEDNEKVSFSGFCIRCRIVSDDVNLKYIQYVVQHPTIRHMITHAGRGCNISNLNQKVLSSLPVNIPPLPLQEAFAARVTAIEEQKSSIAASIEKMQTLLDARMQEYFG